MAKNAKKVGALEDQGRPGEVKSGDAGQGGGKWTQKDAKSAWSFALQGGGLGGRVLEAGGRSQLTRQQV